MHADRLCDFIMKGGITSGVVYPSAITEVAQRFWFSGIAGTSAGAIAAALHAAAELRRRNGSPEGYGLLEGVPGTVGGGDKLLDLFRPDRSTRGAFKLFRSAVAMGDQSAALPIERILGGYIWRKVTFRSPEKQVVDNGLGLCTGMALGNRGGAKLPPLTEWLSEQIDEIAGMGHGHRPLTFGDLHDAPAPSNDAVRAVMGERTGVYLQMITTSLSFARPYAMPYLDERFAFRPSELRQFFPGYVVDYLEERGRVLKEDMATPPPGDLLPMPVGGDMPVIVAVRMSLSFPVLFTPIPLHYPDSMGTGAYRKIWFSDGGITSNLPVYFFDSPFPRWPTLAMNMQYATWDKEKQQNVYGRDGVGDNQRIWMAEDNADGMGEQWSEMTMNGKPLGQLLSFFGAIFRSAQTWSDSTLIKLPGYRDRVAEVWLVKGEGGLNLDMPDETVQHLIGVGRRAGEQLVERFADAPANEEMSWEGHRWCRYRTSMAAMARYLRRWEMGVSTTLAGDRSLDDLLAAVDVPTSYRFRDALQLTEATRVHGELRALVQQASGVRGDAPAGDQSVPFDGGPKSDLAIQPRLSLTPVR